MKMEILEAQCSHGGFIISMAYIPPRNILNVLKLEKELQVERGVYWERQLDDLLSQFHNWILEQLSAIS